MRARMFPLFYHIITSSKLPTTIFYPEMSKRPRPASSSPDEEEDEDEAAHTSKYLQLDTSSPEEDITHEEKDTVADEAESVPVSQCEKTRSPPSEGGSAGSVDKAMSVLRFVPRSVSLGKGRGKRKGKGAES